MSEAIDASLADHTTLKVIGKRELGLDYAKTLRLWRNNFNTHWPEINAQGFDGTFRRMWEFYLAYREAGFATGYINVHKLQMTRPAEMGA